MTRSRKLTTLTLALAVLGVGGCAQVTINKGGDSPFAKVAAIYKEDNAQLALALNKDGSVSVVGVGAGERVKPCEISTKPSPLLGTSKEGTPDQGAREPSPGQGVGKLGAPDPAEIAHCFPDGHVPGKILWQQTYTMTVRKGSLCIDVVSDGKIYVYCNPPDPLDWVE